MPHPRIQNETALAAATPSGGVSNAASAILSRGCPNPQLDKSVPNLDGRRGELIGGVAGPCSLADQTTFGNGNAAEQSRTAHVGQFANLNWEAIV